MKANTKSTLRFTALFCLAALVSAHAESRLVNGSVRASVRTGEETLILGFAIQGPGEKLVVVRAAGPGLGAVAPTLADKVCKDPVLALYDKNGDKIAENDDWDISAAGVMEKVGAFGLPHGSKDAVIVVSLPSGTYTAHVTGSDAGIALAEVYDADIEGIAKLVNLSVRGVAGRGDEALIPGFYFVRYGEPEPFLLRAAGPALGRFGVKEFAPDPRFAVYTTEHDGDTGESRDVKVTDNDDWGSYRIDLEPYMEATGAFPFDRGSKDAAAVAHVNEPGDLTFVIEGGGVVLAEVYMIAP